MQPKGRLPTLLPIQKVTFLQGNVELTSTLNVISETFSLSLSLYPLKLIDGSTLLFVGSKLVVEF